MDLLALWPLMKGQPSPVESRIEVAPFAFRAGVGDVNDSDRTVELIFTTGTGVVRYDWMSGQRYLEKLSLDPAHVRLDRLNDEAPLLDTHSSYSVSSVLGATVPGSAEISAKKGRVKVRFSKRDAVEPVYQDVKARILTKVSVGYLVHKFLETTGKDGSLPVRTAVDWEPYEVSMVPMGADAGARVRSSADASHVSTQPCVLVRSLLATAMSDSDRDRNFRLARARY